MHRQGSPLLTLDGILSYMQAWNMTETSQISSIDEFLFGKLGGHSDSNVFCTFKEQIHTHIRIKKIYPFTVLCL